MAHSNRPANGLPNLEQDVDVILVMGRTGAGKTTFINTVSNSNLTVGHKWRSCTKELSFSNIELYMISRDERSFEERRVVFIDTPGLEDTEMSQAELFDRITALLMHLYESGNRLVGVIYMVDITASRISHSDVTDIDMFRKMVGPNAMRNVFILTTKWPADTPDEVMQEKAVELISDWQFFGELCQEGASVAHLYQSDHPRKIIVDILKQNNPIALRIQQEMVDQKKKLIETEAGSVIDCDVQWRIQQNKELLEKTNRAEQTDKQGHQTQHGGSAGGNGTYYHPIDVDQWDRTEKDRQELKAKVRECERRSVGLNQAHADMFRDGDQIRSSPSGRTAAALVGGLVAALGLTIGGAVLIGGVVGAMGGAEIATVIAGGTMLAEQLLERNRRPY